MVLPERENIKAVCEPEKGQLLTIEYHDLRRLGGYRVAYNTTERNGATISTQKYEKVGC
jgi:hypothetical protein